MDPARIQRRTAWAFWIACGLAAVGGVIPILLAGSSGRVDGVIYPFWFAAVALAACALLQHRGRFLATLLYLVAALAIVYGILAMFALMVSMTVLSPCPPAPATCQLGFAPPLTSSESSGIDFALVLGMLAVGIGFVGMRANYRRHRAQQTTQAAQAAPPVRRVPAQPAHQAAVASEAATREATTPQASAPDVAHDAPDVAKDTPDGTDEDRPE